ncbi:hypothetical protein ABVT39_004871 [Epinephelus coioides]
MLHSLQEKDVHVASVNDTFLSPHIDFSLPGYDIIRSDRPQGKGGGVALLIKRPVVHHETTISLSPEQAQNNEFVTARIKLSSDSSILFMSVYCPPGVTPSPHLFQETLLKEKTVVIMGDLNAKHSSFDNKSTNQSGIILNNITEQFNHVLLNNDEPTHYSSSYNSVDILDLCLVTPDLTGKVIQFSVCPDIGSDHLPITISFNLKAQAAARKLKYDYNTANWEAFKHSTTYLSNNLLPCDPEPSTIDQRALFLGQILLTARENTINLKRVQNGPKNLPLSLIHLIKVKRKLRREFMNTRSPEIKQRVNQLQTQIRREMRKERERTWDRFYTDLNNDPNPKTFWQKIHQINGKENNSKVSVLRNNDKIIEEKNEKANVFKEHLKNVHSCPEDPLFDPEWKEIVERQNIKYAAKKLQVCITEMEGWANMWRVKLNPTKTQCVIFTRHPRKNHQINLKLYGRTLQVTPTAKFLGVTFQQNMQWTAHIADMENEARRRLNPLKVLCRKEGGANPETASRVYQSYSRPLFEYAAPAWCNVGAAQLKKLQTIQNIAIKMCYRIPKYTSNKYTHLFSGFMTLQERMVYLGKKYLHRAETNPSLQPIIEEERTNPPRFICTTPLSVLLKHNIET